MVNRMKPIVGLIIICTFLVLGLRAEDRPIPVSMIQLIATPEKFDGKLINVVGFLGLGERPTLYMYREDGEHALISNSAWVDPSAEMRRNGEELEGMYVRIVGVFRAGQSGHNYPTYDSELSGGISDIKSCTVWSDPERPITHKYDNLRSPGPEHK